MGKFAKAVLGRSELPKNCLVFGGVYVPWRANIVKKQFDAWQRPRGTFVKYVYAKKDRKEYLVCFNVYGATVTLELLHTLKDGNADSVFFVGSMGSESLEIGSIVLPERVVDQAGIVALDEPDNRVVAVSPKSIGKIEGVLKRHEIKHVKGKTASVPSVLHQVKPVKEFMSRNKEILGVELELSTFHHFGRKLGLKTFGLLYVYDNAKHDLISGPPTIWKVRTKALTLATSVALATLNS